MGLPSLWICFYHRPDSIDRWALYLQTDTEAECDIWQVDGQAFEFEPSHIHGSYSEKLPNFKDKWLIKGGLEETEVSAIRRLTGSHPVDNEGAYWDSRVFCFEVLGALETAHIVSRDDPVYQHARELLHDKWKTDDGVSNGDSESIEQDDEEPDLIQTNGLKHLSENPANNKPKMRPDNAGEQKSGSMKKEDIVA